jgi:hypothetical protein
MEETKTTQQIIDERISVLPPSVQHAIKESGWEEKIRNIAKKHNLLIDQAGIVENETFLTMLGLTRPDEYTNNIKDQAELDSTTALSIATDVNNEIFHSIKETLVALSEYEEAMDEYDQAEQELQQSTPPTEPEISRSSVIDEIKNDINIIDDDSEDIEKEILQKAKTSMDLLLENKPESESTPEPKEEINLQPAPTDTDLPSLDPVRTMNKDKEDKDEIISRKLSKPNTAKIDPYREPLV